MLLQTEILRKAIEILSHLCKLSCTLLLTPLPSFFAMFPQACRTENFVEIRYLRLITGTETIQHGIRRWHRSAA